MFGSLKNALGLDTLKVDTRLNQESCMVGTSLKGTVTIKGAGSDKTVNHVDLHLITIAEQDTDDGDFTKAHTLGSVRLANHLTVPAHDQIVLPFELTLSAETPITHISYPHRNQTRLWLHTDVDVARTLDSSDKDPIHTTPTPVMARFLDAMSQVGFHLVKSDVELGYLNTPYGRSSFGCYQEFEYAGRGFGLNSVEVSFLPIGNLTHVVLEVDRAFRSDSYGVITLNDTMTVADMASMIRQKVGV